MCLAKIANVCIYVKYMLVFSICDVSIISKVGIVNNVSIERNLNNINNKK